MKTVFEKRASTILYNIILSGKYDRTGVYLLPANICPIVPLLIIKSGAKVEFIDIDSSTLCMSEEHTLRRLLDRNQERVSGIVYVRTYGYSSDISSFIEKVNIIDKDIIFVDDRCVAKPETEAKYIDNMGADIVLFSTGYGKYVDLGFGGFAYMNKNIYYESHHQKYDSASLEMLINTYKKHIANMTNLAENEYSIVKGNWIDTTQPDVSWEEYKELVTVERSRIQTLKTAYNKLYSSILPEEYCMKNAYNDWRFNILVKDKVGLLNEISNRGYFASGHYFPSSLLLEKNDYPVSMQLYKKVVNLFNDKYVNEEQVKKVAEIVRDIIIDDSKKSLK